MDNAKQTQINNKPHVELISIESSKDTISISSSKPQLENINDHVLPQIVTTQLCQSQSNQQTEPRDTSDIGHAEAPKSDQAFIKNSLSLLLLLIIHVGPHLVSEEFISKLYPEIAEVSQI